MDWLKNEITQAAANGMNVVLLFSFSWKNDREFNSKTIHEKIELAELIMALGFNQGTKWLVMMSGDAHMTTFDSGEFNLYGGFPIFQCSSLDSGSSCKNPGWSSPVFIRRGSFCKFEIYETSESQKCLKFEGFRMDTKLMEYDICNDARFKFEHTKQLKLSDNSSAWEWFKLKPSVERDIMIDDASKQLL
jgi:hypothetical protein